MLLHFAALSDQLQTVSEAARQQPASFVHARSIETTTRCFCMAELSCYACITETHSDHYHFFTLAPQPPRHHVIVKAPWSRKQ